MKGILLDNSNDLMVSVKRDSSGKITQGLVVDERKMQDAYIVLSVNQGEIKEDPIAGANLTRLIRGKESTEKIRKMTDIALKRVGISLDEIKGEIELSINRTKYV